MRQTTRERLRYYGRKSSAVIYILGFVLGAIGSYQVYHGQFASPLREVSAILYSVVKLFTFAPTVDITKSAPLAYDLARWIAPIGTVLGLFTVFGAVYTAIRLHLHHFRQDPMVVLGANDRSMVFMKNVLRDRPRQRIACIVAEGSKELDPKALEKLNIRVCALDYKTKDSYTNRKTVKDCRIDRANVLVCFETESQNYGYLSVLNDLLSSRTQKPVDAYVNTESSRLREIVQQPMGQLAHLSIHYFNTHDLSASVLMNDPDFQIHRTPGLGTSWADLHFDSLEALSAKLGNVHLLLVGFSDQGRHVLKLASNQATMNATGRLHVTIVDHNIQSLFEVYEAEVEQHDRVFDVELHELDIHSKAMLQKLDALQGQLPVTAVVYALKDTRESLLNIERCGRRLKEIPTAVFCENATELGPFIQAMKSRYKRLVFFGQLEDVLTEDVIINESQLQKAKQFNAYYNHVTAELMAWPQSTATAEEQWRKLSATKRESSVYQTMHQNVKRDILTKLCELPGYPDDVDALIARWRGLLEGHSIAEQVDIIEADVGMNYMTALEHRRWNNFHYMRGFRYGATKDEFSKTHDCLIDNWSEFMKALREKAIYDFLSTLSIGKG
jgi:hypothetical protein